MSSTPSTPESSAPDVDSGEVFLTSQQIAALTDREALNIIIKNLGATRRTLKLENEKRDRRIRWSRWAIAISLLIGVSGPVYGIWARTHISSATCNMGEALVSGLIRSSSPDEDTTAEELQEQIDQFTAFMDEETRGLGCDFKTKFDDVVPVTTTTRG